MDVLARQMVSSVPFGDVSLFGTVVITLVNQVFDLFTETRPPNGLFRTFSAFRDSLVSFVDLSQYRFLHGDWDYETATFE